tara:strand:- start:300 stop:884 length:585 start_codon:yes stop_codon:yes gene_type:complete
MDLSKKTFSYFKKIPNQISNILDQFDLTNYEVNKTSSEATSSKAKMRTSFKLYEKYYSKAGNQLNLKPHQSFNTIARKGKYLQFSNNLLTTVSQYFNTPYVQLSNNIIYPEFGYMGWHTNNSSPGYRLYLNYVKENDKSFFRYVDPETNEQVTSYDKTGWQARLFFISTKSLFWHCVYAETSRVSLGFRIIKLR